MEIIREFNIKEYIVVFGRKLKHSSLVKEVDVRIVFKDGSKMLYNSYLDNGNESQTL